MLWRWRITASGPKIAVRLRRRLWGWGGRRAGPLKREIRMFLMLFIVAVVLWAMGFIVFHVAGGLIHLLLLIGVISLIVHFVRPRRAAV